MSDITELVYLGLLIVVTGSVIRDRLFLDWTRKEIRKLRLEVRRLEVILNDETFSKDLRKNTMRGRKPRRMAIVKVMGADGFTKTSTPSSASKTEISS